MTKAKIHEYIMTLLLVVCIFVGTAICDWGFNASIAFADTDDVQTRYEQTNVMSNLNGSTIGGKQFDIKDYPHNEAGSPQIISLVEFCYSYYGDKQYDYGLYIYVYNPQDKAIDTNTDRNKIQLTYGDKPSYGKYTLKFLNYSKDEGIEGRFYKFKIDLTPKERADILKTVTPDERVYKISGIELSVKNEVTEYGTAQSYTYKGFAKGYGSELAESDTLSCKVDGFDKYISLDVKSTYWRPSGTHEDKITRDTLHSVYFSVPNKIISDYGEMTGVHATWLNAYTTPIFVTGNKTVYNAITSKLGWEIRGGDMSNGTNELDYALLAMKGYTGSESAMKNNYYNLHYGFNNYETDSKHPRDGGLINVHQVNKQVTELNYCFFAENSDADTYSLPAEMLIGDKDKNIKGWFATYTEKHGGELTNNRYSKALFETVDTQFTDVNIRSTDTFKLQDTVFSNNFWEILFGNYITAVNSYKMQAIQKVTLEDIDGTDKYAFCDGFYIDTGDYDEFKQYVTESNAKDETVYLFRYYQSEYVSAEVTEVKRYYHNKAAFKSCMFHSDCPFGHGYYEYVDSNAFMAQMWVQLDFDIIDLTFTKDNVTTIIPVVMHPTDIAADADHPVYTTDDSGTSWWKILLAILLGILVIFLLLKFAPIVFVVIGKAIAIPFKALGAGFKSIGERIKPIHEKNKQQRQERREQKRIEREKERERIAAEKQRLRDEKRESKVAEKERKRQERERIRLRDKDNKSAWKRHKKELRLENKSQKITQDIWSGKKTYARLNKREKDLVDNHSPFTRYARDMEEIYNSEDDD